MKKLTSFEIRNMFLQYFEQAGHSIETGASLVPINDPSLLWINSGVSAIKKYFDGSERPKNPRITNSQRSIRTNDIENVGVTARHHTMFEMLGNFSIGDYFKQEAIKFAWEFLTSEDWIGLDKDKLYITIYTDDNEAFDIWTNIIGISSDRIFRMEENFWEIGEGPSGPNTEIFYDRGTKYDPENIGLKLLAEDLENDRYVEIWNVVFSQFNAVVGVDRKDYEPLPQQNIDTGMGLERLVSVIQETDTNFETDLFLPIIKEIEKLANVKYEEYSKAFRIIADHMRAITFALADGAMFSNEGRGYVLKRLLRRAIRFGLEIGIKDLFLAHIVQFIIEHMKEYYDYLSDKEDLIKKMVTIEEERFHKTLADGLKLFEQVKEQSINKLINGADAFKLYDTYGFPIELTIELSSEAGYTVNMDEFNEHMNKQKELARSNSKDGSNMQNQSAALLNFTNHSEFIGYTSDTCNAIVIGLFKDGVHVDELDGQGDVIFDITPCYAESGGQVGDKATITCSGKQYLTTNVSKAVNGQHLHQFKDIKVKLNDQVTIEIDKKRRQQITKNHTATHLLHQALKEIVGVHVNQAGSYVDYEYLRFDFNHYEKVNDKLLDQIEERVNEIIYDSLDIKIDLMDIEQAKQSGAMALFSDKYDDIVRVVNVPGYSIELCGGTHVNNTSEIGLFKIEREESVGSGIRRIIACTSKIAVAQLNRYQERINNLSSSLGLKNHIQLEDKVVGLLESINSLKQENVILKEKLASAQVNDATIINDIKYFFIMSMDDDIKTMKELVDKYKNEHPDSCIILYSEVNKKPYVIGLGKDLLDKGLSTRNYTVLINEAFNGKGGGKPDLAQGATESVIDIEIICGVLENSSF